MHEDEQNAEGVFSGYGRAVADKGRALMESLGLDADEPLIPELKARIYDDGWTILHHPLVISVPYIEVLNARFNAQFRSKQSGIARAVSESDWSTAVFLHERPYRVDAFYEMMDKMSDSEYWSLLSEIWTDSENIRQNPSEWEDLLLSERDGKEGMMTPEEQEELSAMPETITLYQGHTDERDDGWSWTTDKSIAEWFGLRFSTLESAEPLVTTAKVKKSDVHAYLTRRGEKEVIVNPELVHSRSTNPVELTSDR